VLLGWIIVVPAYEMWSAISSTSLGWLVAGGLAYTVGAVVYAR
jgi:hemolysin III